MVPSLPLLIPLPRERYGNRGKGRQEFDNRSGDTLRNLSLESVAPQELFLFRIGYIGSLDQNRRDIGMFEHDKRRFLDGRKFQAIRPFEVMEETAAEGSGLVYGAGLEHAENDWIGGFATFPGGNSADDIGQVFITCKNFAPRRCLPLPWTGSRRNCRRPTGFLPHQHGY